MPFCSHSQVVFSKIPGPPTIFSDDNHYLQFSLTDITGPPENFVNLLLAMLVIEDALLGILMATLPLIAGHSTEKSHSLAHAPLGLVHHWFHGTFEG